MRWRRLAVVSTAAPGGSVLDEQVSIMTRPPEAPFSGSDNLRQEPTKSRPQVESSSGTPQRPPAQSARHAQASQQAQTVEPRTLRSIADIPLTRLRGVGPAMLNRLDQVGIANILDLVTYYPRRWVDRSEQQPIAGTQEGDEVTVVGDVTAIRATRTRQRRTMVQATVSDGTAKIAVTFFNQGWRERQLSVGTTVALYGKVGLFRGQRQLTNPTVDVLGTSAERQTGVVVPLYPSSEKADIGSGQLSRLIRTALGRIVEFADPVPEGFRRQHGLSDRTWAMNAIHAPESIADAMKARRRLALDEFLRMQVALVARRRRYEAETTGVVCDGDTGLVPQMTVRTGFALTADQVAAIDAIHSDMARTIPMARLLQGDVGSGKTLVAVAAMLRAVESGHQAILMAPTEVLAEQHATGIRALVDGLNVAAPDTLLGERPVRLALLTNQTPASERKMLATALTRGEVDLVIGTHALLFGEWHYKSLALVVVDEQHRFGVEQRAALTARAVPPHQLVMTATPIPRTAAMLIYGDLDRSELREMPPGRTPIHTRLVGSDSAGDAAVIEQVRSEVAAGRQAYVVFPLVSPSENVEARDATTAFEELRYGPFTDLSVGLLHGQMPASAKADAMDAFRSGATDILIATTVIEVGVDVPNATVMVIYDADRFGLSQLHQLRGRVGRGRHASTCLLVASPQTTVGDKRLQAMVESSDGFALAEIDLELRGAGEVFGERQAGISDLKLGRIPRDTGLVDLARQLAEQMVGDDPYLDSCPQMREEITDLLGDDADFLFKH